MKQTFKLLLIMLALQLWPTVGYCLKDGDTFTAPVPLNGSGTVQMTFKVISEANKTAQIGSGRYNKASGIDNDTYGDVVIPATVNGYNIVSISVFAFYHCSNLLSVEIPNSVTSIGIYAFSGCSVLESVNIPEDSNLKEIGSYAFESCEHLSSINIPRNVKDIGGWAFRNCKQLSSVIFHEGCYCVLDCEQFDGCDMLTQLTIPKGVKFSSGMGAANITSVTLLEGRDLLSTMAFYNCQKLSSVKLPQSLKYIGKQAFWNCKSLKTIEIPNSVTTIADMSFWQSGIMEIIIPASVKTIGEGAFSNCMSLESIDIPNSVEKIGEGAFKTCHRLTSIKIPNSVTTINKFTFFDCVRLKTIEIPNSVTSIGEQAFYGCVNLTSIEIPNSVTSIGEKAFYKCSRLSSIVVQNGNSKYDSRNNCNALIQTDNNELIYGCKNTIIPNGIKIIGNGAFYNCGITSVEIPNSVTTIGEQAFDGCYNLTSIEIPNSVTSIGEKAFYGCSSLSSIIVQNGNSKYDSRNNCNALIQTDNNELILGCMNTNIPNGIKIIGEGAFYGCDFTSIEIPNSVTSIGENAFICCYSLTSITSHIQYPFPISSDCFDSSVYEKATLYVPANSLGLYLDTEGWMTFKNIKNIEVISIKVNNDNGEDLTNHVSVIWYDKDGRELGTGTSISGFEEGTTLYYSILLDEELGSIYGEIIMQPVVLGQGTITCRLQKIEQVWLHGLVMADGLPAAKSDVKVKQWLNGRYKQEKVYKTDSQGQFSVKAYCDSTEIIISYDGFMDSRIVKDFLDMETNLGTIYLERIHGKVLVPDFTYQATVREGTSSTIQNFYSDVQNINYTITNDTKQTQVENFNVQQNGNIVITDGAETGDQLTITSISLNNKFARVSMTTALDESDTTHVEMPLVELGGIYVEYESKADDLLLALIYDASGKLASRATFSSDIVTFTGLEEGSYSVVTFGYDGSLASVSDLSGLSAVGLEEGVDYTLSHVSVRNGILSTMVVENVPEWESAKFSYTTGNTSYLPNKSQMTYGGYVTMAARVDFREQFKEDVEDVKLVINIPEGCDLIGNCVVIDNKLVPYTLNGNTLTIQVPKDVMDTRIRFCFKPNMYGTFTSTAYAEFNYYGEHTQSIGTAVFDVDGASISVPNKTNTSKIHIRGIALPKAEIDVCDNDHLIGSTQALADGSWKIDSELYKPYNLSTHVIYAKIKATNGLTAMTESQKCIYEKLDIGVKTVTMTFYNGWLMQNVSVVFDFETGKTSSKSYSFYTATDVTFVADLTNNDTVNVKGVTFYVHTSSKEIRTLNGFYDENLDRWVAVDKFDSWNLPVNLSLKIDKVEAEQLTDRNEIDDKLNEQEESLIEAKGELADLDAIFDKVDNLDGEPSAYEKLLSLLEKGNYSETEYRALINEIQSVPLPTNIEAIGEGQLDEDYIRLMKEYEDFVAKYSKDSVYAALGINANLRDVEWPTSSYSGNIKNGKENRTYTIEHLTSIDEAELFAQGFSIIPVTDGSKLYCLENETEVIYIDGKTNTKYSFAIVKEANGKRRINMDFQTIMSLNPQFAPFIMLRDFVTELVNQDGYNQEMLQRQIDYINPIIKAVENVYTNYLSWMNNSLLTWYNRYTQTCNIIADAFEVDKVRYANEFKDLTSSIVGLPNVQEARRMAELIVREQACERSANFCKSNLAKVNAAYERVRGWIKQLPEVPSVRVCNGLRLTGQLALGGFGLFIELIDMYSDLRNARDNYIGWIDLLNEVDRIIPCPKNPEAALELQRQVRSDARDLVHNYDRIFTAEIQAMELDVVSLVSAIGGLATGPGALFGEAAAFVLDLASGIYGIYSEASKTLSINGKFRSYEANYWTRLLNIKCKKDKEEQKPDTDPKPNDPYMTNDDWEDILHPAFKNITPIHDPSGYVYEAVPSNRMEGVTASIYYDENNPQLWDAADYSQVNPIVTDETGLYAWDVPQGMWQVRFEKEGYETTQTDWLPVPPPQLEINIPMSQAIAPEVTKARGAESGIWLTFSKYMKPETLTKNGRVSVNCNGKTIKGDLELLDLEEDPYNKHEYASKVKFVPDVAFNTTDEVIITVKKEVESYASMQMENDFVQRVTIEPEIKNISCDSLIVVDYQNAKTIEIAVLPASAAKGKIVQVATTSPMIASVDRSEVTLDDEGKAHVTVSGNLPGGAALLFSLPEAELSVAPQVQVVIHENVVRNPKASKRSGSVVEEGFLLTLTCATVGATIYYTTDGSCPCDEKTRKRYDAPISITSDMTINAIAVREGMEDSEVVTFTYKIGDPSSIATVGNEAIGIEYQNGAFVITGAEGATCNIYDLAGQLVASRQRIARRERMVFSKKGVYVVNVETTDGITVAKKMVVK
ncbi:MAG: leucine-rich repeat protein [Prevotella sp.]|nr:leucine-rich repeat protein [Prevotella sp.]